MFDPHTGQPIQPVPATLYLDAKPEKEYTVHDCCYPNVSGGGYQKIKLYKDDIVFEQTCPCPWCIFMIPGFGCLFPFTCPIFWCLKGKTFVTRKPYRELKSMEYVTSEGCCDCCCLDSYYIGGLFGEPNRQMLPMIPQEMADKAKMKEMVGDISQAMAQKSFTSAGSVSV